MKGGIEMGRWRWQTDWLSGRSALGAYAVYLAYLWIRAPFYAGIPRYTQQGVPSAGDNVYFYLQMLPCVFVVFITAAVFYETFRPGGREYLSAFPVRLGGEVLKRSLRLWLLLAVLNIPLCIFARGRINTSIAFYIAEHPELAGFPDVPLRPMLVQCLIALAFYISLGLVLLMLFKSRHIPVILVIIYCLMEYGPLRAALGRYAVFYGSAGSPELYTLLPPNMYILAGLAAVFIAVTCMSFTRRAGLHRFRPSRTPPELY